jgi:hypothetical protein
MMKNEKLKMSWDRDSADPQDWAQTIVSQSLKTADGVLPVPQQELWYYEAHMIINSGYLIGMEQFGPNSAKFVLKTNAGPSKIRNKRCYSTKEALETAKWEREFLWRVSFHRQKRRDNE